MGVSLIPASAIIVLAVAWFRMLTKKLAELSILCKVWAMGKVLFSRRYAMPLCAVALLYLVLPSFAQSPPENALLIGRWELFSVGGHETALPREKIHIEDERLSVRDDCNSTTYRYAVNDGQMTAKPDLTSLLLCNKNKSREEEIARRNQDAIVAAIMRSKVLLDGDILKLLPNSLSSGELEFHRMTW